MSEDEAAIIARWERQRLDVLRKFRDALRVRVENARPIAEDAAYGGPPPAVWKP